MLKCVGNWPNSINLDFIPGWMVHAILILPLIQGINVETEVHRVALGKFYHVPCWHPELMLLNAGYCPDICVVLLGYQHTLLCISGGASGMARCSGCHTFVLLAVSHPLIHACFLQYFSLQCHHESRLGALFSLPVPYPLLCMQQCEELQCTA